MRVERKIYLGKPAAKMLRTTLSCLVGGIALFSQLADAQSTLLPTVDLGYEIHRAAFFNVSLNCIFL